MTPTFSNGHTTVVWSYFIDDTHLFEWSYDCSLQLFTTAVCCFIIHFVSHKIFININQYLCCFCGKFGKIYELQRAISWQSQVSFFQKNFIFHITAEKWIVPNDVALTYFIFRTCHCSQVLDKRFVVARKCYLFLIVLLNVVENVFIT